MNFIVLFITLFGTIFGSTPNIGEGSFVLSGSIKDKDTNEPVSFAYIHLEELNRTAASDIDGLFELKNVPEGSYTLSIHRIGYKTQKRKIEISADLELSIKLTQTLLTTETIEVIGKNNELTGSNIEHISESVSGTSLRQNLGTTLANTLSNLPGVDQRSLEIQLQDLSYVV